MSEDVQGNTQSAREETHKHPESSESSRNLHQIESEEAKIDNAENKPDQTVSHKRGGVFGKKGGVLGAITPRLS
jgi:hypothetical protein